MDSHTGPKEWHHKVLRLVVLSGLAGLPASARGQGGALSGSLSRGSADPATSLMTQVEGRTVCSGTLAGSDVAHHACGHAASCAEPWPHRAGAGQGAARFLNKVTGTPLSSAPAEILGDLQTDPRVHDLDAGGVSL